MFHYISQTCKAAEIKLLLYQRRLSNLASSTRKKHLVEEGVLAVEEVGVGAPDLGEELPVHRQLLQARLIEPQPVMISLVIC